MFGAVSFGTGFVVKDMTKPCLCHQRDNQTFTLTLHEGDNVAMWLLRTTLSGGLPQTFILVAEIFLMLTIYIFVTRELLTKIIQMLWHSVTRNISTLMEFVFHRIKLVLAGMLGKQAPGSHGKQPMTVTQSSGSKRSIDASKNIVPPDDDGDNDDNDGENDQWEVNSNSKKIQYNARHRDLSAFNVCVAIDTNVLVHWLQNKQNICNAISSFPKDIVIFITNVVRSEFLAKYTECGKTKSEQNDIMDAILMLKNVHLQCRNVAYYNDYHIHERDYDAKIAVSLIDFLKQNGRIGLALLTSDIKFKQRAVEVFRLLSFNLEEMQQYKTKSGSRLLTKMADSTKEFTIRADDTIRKLLQILWNNNHSLRNVSGWWKFVEKHQ